MRGDRGAGLDYIALSLSKRSSTGCERECAAEGTAGESDLLIGLVEVFGLHGSWWKLKMFEWSWYYAMGFGICIWILERLLGLVERAIPPSRCQSHVGSE